MSGLIIVMTGVSLVAAVTLALVVRRSSRIASRASDTPGDTVGRPTTGVAPTAPAPRPTMERGQLDPVRDARPRVREPHLRTQSSQSAVTEEAIGVTRREFFNRGLLAVMSFAIAGAGSAVLALLWPQTGTSAGFGGEIAVTGLSKILTQIDQKRAPFYVPAARTWLQSYPASALPKAKKVYEPVVIAGMERGIVALYQRCPHLGCRVPWCQSSQWFECPCHGSKYNAVGEKKAGPAPRGMDRFGLAFNGDNVTIDTETVILGPPVGTNTTGQDAAGPLCV